MQGLISRLFASSAALALLSLTYPAGAQSPQGPSVAAGSITVGRQGSTTVVTQGSQRGIIDWRSFSIGAQEAVRFDQPGRASVTLNRVVGAEASRLDGSLSANGQVWLANPNGVMIGPSGQVNVGGLLATTGRVDAQEFLRAGRAQIDQISRDAAIANAGTVNIAEGGYAALAAASIRNDGVVAARAGSVAFGAGRAMTVDFMGDRLIAFQVTGPLDQAPGNADALIVSAGTIVAQGGAVLMSARAAKGVLDKAINLTGHVVANSVRVDGGAVIFGDGGIVQVSGKIDASDAAGAGGSVAVLGEKVGLLDGARIDASGATGGGTVLVGGDWQGKGPTHTATVAYVAPTAVIAADAARNGAGGKVVVWADDTTRFHGSISARGGVEGGDGGQVETSGKKSLQVGPTAGVATLGRSPLAKAGSWLLDPTDITIVATGSDLGVGQAAAAGGSVFTPNPALLGGATTSTITLATLATALTQANVTILTTSTQSGAGDILFNGGGLIYSVGAPRTLTLQADRHISLTSASIAGVSGGVATGLSLTLKSGARGAVSLNSSTINIGGALSVAGGQAGLAPTATDAARVGVTIFASTVSAAGGVSILGFGGHQIGGTNGDATGVFINNSAITVTGANALSLSGTGGTLALTSGATGGTAQGITINAGSLTSGGDIILDGKGGSGAVQADGVSLGIISNVGSKLTAGGTGTLSITGVGGSGPSGSFRGVSIIGGTLSTAGGALRVDWTGGTAISAGGDVRGLAVSPFYGSTNSLPTRIDSSGGSISLIGKAGTVSSGTFGNATGANIIGASISGGAVNLNGTGGSVTASSGSAVGLAIESSFFGSLLLQAVTTASGAAQLVGKGGTLSSTTGGDTTGVRLSGGALTGAGVAIDGIGGSGSTTFAPGVDVFSLYSGGSTADVASVTATGSTPMTITGKGGTAASGVVTGVRIGRSALASSGGVTITGTGGTLASSSGTVSGSGGAGVDVYAQGTIPFGSSISSSAGSIRLAGTGGSGPGATMHGLNLQYARIASAANLTIEGTGGASTVGTLGVASGVQSYASNFSAAKALAITGTGGSATSSDGVGLTFVSPGETVAAFGAEGLTITGTAGATSGGEGARVNLGAGTISGDGAITMSGTGGGGPGVNNRGLALFLSNGGLLRSTGAGIALSGTRGTGSVGSSQSSANVIVTGTGSGQTGTIDAATNLTLSGTATAGSASGINFGVLLAAKAIAGGAITLTGRGGSSGNSNFGVLIGDSNSVATLSAGSGVTLDGAGGSGNAAGIIGGAGSSVTVAEGQITIASDSAANLGATKFTAQNLLLTGAGNFILTNADNAIGVLAASGAISVNVVNGPTAGLTVGTVAGISGVTASGAVKLRQTGLGRDLIIDSMIKGGSVSLASETSIAGTGMVVAGSAPLILAATGGSVTAVVNGKTGSEAADLVSVAAGSINVNGVLKTYSAPSPATPPPPSPDPAPAVSAPTTASAPSMPSAPSVASVPSLATVASTPSVASPPSLATIASVPSIASLPSQATVAAIAPAPPPSRAIIEPTPVVAAVGQIAATIVQPAPTAARSTSAQAVMTAAERAAPSEQSGSTPPISARAASAAVTATASGALIPPTPPSVAGTGAPLASAPTIKVDAADTGGANGQVIAATASSPGSASKTVAAGLVTEAPPLRPRSVEPPLAQQPSQLNEENFLD